MYPSPCSHPVANSSSWSGVHIQVTAGSPFTSSQTGTSSTAADSASIRPRRLPGCRSGAVVSDPGREPGVPRSRFVVDPGLAPGVSGSRFTEVFRVDMRPLLNPDPVESDALRELRGDPLPHVHRQGLPRREPPPGSRGELGERLVDAPAIEPRRDLPGE